MLHRAESLPEASLVSNARHHDLLLYAAFFISVPQQQRGGASPPPPAFEPCVTFISHPQFGFVQRYVSPVVIATIHFLIERRFSTRAYSLGNTVARRDESIRYKHLNLEC
jgi:hypothetical protein